MYRANCHTERSGENRIAILPAESKYPYSSCAAGLFARRYFNSSTSFSFALLISSIFLISSSVSF